MVKQYPVPFHTEKSNKEDVKNFTRPALSWTCFFLPTKSLTRSWENRISLCHNKHSNIPGIY